MPGASMAPKVQGAKMQTYINPAVWTGLFRGKITQSSSKSKQVGSVSDGKGLSQLAGRRHYKKYEEECG
jgi:hypothetical protein